MEEQHGAGREPQEFPEPSRTAAAADAPSRSKSGSGMRGPVAEGPRSLFVRLSTLRRLTGARFRRLAMLVVGLVGIVVTGLGVAVPREAAPRVDIPKVIAQYPHDPQAFCQGLVIHDGQLYEGTGEYGRSTLRKVDLTTGRPTQIVPLANDYFGEGITVWGKHLLQLTWKERLGIIYDRESLEPVSSFRYTGEGWGLTTDGKHLILSDGTAILRFLSPETFEVVRRVVVRSRGSKLEKINELEFVEGEIYANLWYSDRIARISPETGEVLGFIDCSGLYPAGQRPSREHVLNGIAYDRQAKRLFVTGKNWPRLYELAPLPALTGR